MPPTQNSMLHIFNFHSSDQPGKLLCPVCETIIINVFFHIFLHEIDYYNTQSFAYTTTLQDP